MLLNDVLHPDTGELCCSYTNSCSSLHLHFSVLYFGRLTVLLIRKPFNDGSLKGMKSGSREAAYMCLYWILGFSIYCFSQFSVFLPHHIRNRDWPDRGAGSKIPSELTADKLCLSPGVISCNNFVTESFCRRYYFRNRFLTSFIFSCTDYSCIPNVLHTL